MCGLDVDTSHWTDVNVVIMNNCITPDVTVGDRAIYYSSFAEWPTSWLETLRRSRFCLKTRSHVAQTRGYVRSVNVVTASNEFD